MVDEAVFPASLDVLASVRGYVSDTARRHCQDGAFLFDLILAVDELVTNIILYGYREQSGEVMVRIERKAQGLTVTLVDTAPPFDPTGVPPPQLDLPLEQRREGGLGIHLARELTDGLEYFRNPEGTNELKIFKRFPPQATHR